MTVQFPLIFTVFVLQLGGTPLHLAARFGSGAVLKKLLESGADIDAADDVCIVLIGKSAVLKHD